MPFQADTLPQETETVKICVMCSAPIARTRNHYKTRKCCSRKCGLAYTKKYSSFYKNHSGFVAACVLKENYSPGASCRG